MTRDHYLPSLSLLYMRCSVRFGGAAASDRCRGDPSATSAGGGGEAELSLERDEAEECEALRAGALRVSCGAGRRGDIDRRRSTDLRLMAEDLKRTQNIIHVIVLR